VHDAPTNALIRNYQRAWTTYKVVEACPEFACMSSNRRSLQRICLRPKSLTKKKDGSCLE